MLAILGATSYSFYSDCRILSNRNAILSIKVTIFLSILILSTHLRGILFILSFIYCNSRKNILTDKIKFINSIRIGVYLFFVGH